MTRRVFVGTSCFHSQYRHVMSCYVVLSQFPSQRFHVPCHLICSRTEIFKYPHVILLVDPDDECLLVVVEDASGVGPITSHAGGRQQRRNGLIEEVVLVDELLLELFGHFRHLEISSAEFAVEFTVVKGSRHHLLHFAAFGARAHGRQRQATNVAA